MRKTFFLVLVFFKPSKISKITLRFAKVYVEISSDYWLTAAELKVPLDFTLSGNF